jgi:hypothetical protein
MNIVWILIVVGIAGGGYNTWKQHHGNTIQVGNKVQVGSRTVISENGFASLPPVNGQTSRKVYVLAPENCPGEDAKRADSLAADLSRKGIPVVRRDSARFSLSSQLESDVQTRMSEVMGGPLPIVFVDGRAKSNPSLDEVVAEFRGNYSQ